MRRVLSERNYGCNYHHSPCLYDAGTLDYRSARRNGFTKTNRNNVGRRSISKLKARTVRLFQVGRS